MEQKGGNKVFYTVPFIWNRTLWVMTWAPLWATSSTVPTS